MQQNDNPYAAPDVELTPQSSPAKEHYGAASHGQRFGNYVVDHIAVTALAGIVGAIIGASSPDGAALFQSTIFSYGISILTAILYYTLLETLTGRTLGKLVMGTKVIGPDGGKPALLRAIGRSFARYIPFEPLAFLVGGDKPAWHDSLSSTLVVRLRPSDLQRALEDA